MKNSIKAAIAGVAVTAALATGGILALLHDDADQTTTFTSGNISITASNNESKKVLPGKSYGMGENTVKVTVEKGSEASYLFAVVATPVADSSAFTRTPPFSRTINGTTYYSIVEPRYMGGDLAGGESCWDRYGNGVLGTGDYEGYVLDLLAYTGPNQKQTISKDGAMLEISNLQEDLVVPVYDLVMVSDVKDTSRIADKTIKTWFYAVQAEADIMSTDRLGAILPACQGDFKDTPITLFSVE